MPMLNYEMETRFYDERAVYSDNLNLAGVHACNIAVDLSDNIWKRTQQVDEYRDSLIKSLKENSDSEDFFPEECEAFQSLVKIATDFLPNQNKD